MDSERFEQVHQCWKNRAEAVGNRLIELFQRHASAVFDRRCIRPIRLAWACYGFRSHFAAGNCHAGHPQTTVGIETALNRIKPF